MKLASRPQKDGFSETLVCHLLGLPAFRIKSSSLPPHLASDSLTSRAASRASLDLVTLGPRETKMRGKASQVFGVPKRKGWDWEGVGHAWHQANGRWAGGEDRQGPRSILPHACGKQVQGLRGHRRPLPEARESQSARLTALKPDVVRGRSTPEV